jgi:hypothetical protein
MDGYLVGEKSPVTFDRGIALNLVKYTTADTAGSLLDEVEFNKQKTNLTLLTNTTMAAIELFPSTKTTDLPAGIKNLVDLAIDKNLVQPNYVLIAWVSVTDAENNYCMQGDCNSKGIQRNDNTRYFLMQNNLFPPQNSAGAEMLLCASSRIKNLSTLTSSAGFYQANFTAWTKCLGAIKPYLSFGDVNRSLGLVTSILGQDEMNNLTGAVNKFVQIGASVTASNCPQYYISFAADLARAINELVVFYNEYVRKYPNIGAARLEKTLVLGGIKQTGFDTRRYYFLPSPAQVEYRASKQILQKLFTRILVMVNRFLQIGVINSFSIKVPKPQVIPSFIGPGLLENQAIPFYYDISISGADIEVFRSWNPHGGSARNIYNYFDSVLGARNDMSQKLPDASWSEYNFFRIEGFINMNKDTALSAISSLITEGGIPIQLIDVNVNYKGPIKWIDWYNTFLGDLAVWVPTLRKDPQEYTFDPILNIKNRITQTSYRNVDEVSKIANDFYAYSNVFYSNSPKGIKPEAVTKFKGIVKADQIKVTRDNFKAALDEHKELKATKLITLKDLVGLEYLGGAPRGGTFVLLHDGATVIGDGCLSWYYKVDQVRVF